MNKVKFTLLAASIMLAMVFIFSCSGDDGNGGNGDDGNGGGQGVTVTFSLDKVDARTFTATLEGAKWDSSMGSSGWSANSYLFNNDQSTLSGTTTTGQGGSGHVLNLFNTTRTDTVLTFELNDNYSSVSGTIGLNTEPQLLAVITDLKVVGNNTFTINPAKASITF